MLRFFVGFLATGLWVFSLVSCKTRTFSASATRSQADLSSDGYFEPVAEYVGRLVFPSPAELDDVSQRSDQAVWDRDSVRFQISHAPESSGLKAGDTVWLTWQPGAREAIEARQLSAVQMSEDLLGSMHQDVRPGDQNFGRLVKIPADVKDKVQPELQALGDVLPLRLHQFSVGKGARRALGPLLSLAGGRSEDSVFVRLQSDSLSEPGSSVLATNAPIGASGQLETILQINRPPVQTAGSHYGLVRLVGKSAAEPHFFSVQPIKGGQDVGAPQNLRFLPPVARAKGAPSYDLDRLLLKTNEPFGSELFVYVRKNGDDWVVYGIEPRVLTRVASLASQAALSWPDVEKNAFRDISENDNLKPVFGKQSKSPEVGSLWSKAVLPRADDGAVRTGSEASDFAVGTRGLLFHVFGGIGGKDGDNQAGDKFSPGHFAFGSFVVRRDPFSAEDRFTITYHQIYAQSPDGILSGSQDYNAYSGDLHRGWVFSRPIGDMLVADQIFDRAFELQMGDGKMQITVLDGIVMSIEEIMAMYRVGFGTGRASVTPVTSCSQDSILAMHLALDRAGSLRGLSLDEDLKVLGQRFSEAFDSPLSGATRQDWKAYIESRARKTPEGLGRLVQASLQSAFSVTPRSTFDVMIDVFRDRQPPAALLRTNMPVAAFAGKDMYPLEPTKINTGAGNVLFMKIF